MKTEANATGWKRCEISYVIPAGREMRFTAKRKVVAGAALAKTVAALIEQGARDFAYSEAAS